MFFMNHLVPHLRVPLPFVDFEVDAQYLSPWVRKLHDACHMWDDHLKRWDELESVSGLHNYFGVEILGDAQMLM